MDSPGCRTRLDLIPVRCEIHSSLVSTNSEISVLLRAVFGLEAPQLRTVLSSVACWSVRGAGLIAGAFNPVVSCSRASIHRARRMAGMLMLLLQ